MHKTVQFIRLVIVRVGSFALELISLRILRARADELSFSSISAARVYALLRCL